MPKRGKLKKVTLKDIAMIAGVSVPTASQILNNRENNYCSEAKKQRVRQVARELNYQPSFGYKVMCGQKTNTVALVCSLEESLYDEHIKELVFRLMSDFEKLGYFVYSSIMTKSTEENIDKMTALINRGCSSFVLLGHITGAAQIVKLFASNKLDYISFRSATPRNIIVNFPYTFRRYINDLLNEDRKNFKILTNNMNDIQGLIKAFPKSDPESLVKKLVVPLSLNRPLNNSYENNFLTGYNQTKQLLINSPGIQGIIYHSGYYALGGAKFLAEKGFKVGSDIKLYVYNNVNASILFHYPISISLYNTDKICKTITERLFRPGSMQIAINPKVIIK